MKILRGHTGGVRSAAFSPDGMRIVTASGSPNAKQDWAARVFDVPRGERDNTARIWDASTGNEIKVLRGHEEQVTSGAFSPDGTRISTASEDNTARIWDVRVATMSTKALLVEACTRRLPGLSILTRDEMRLAGYSEETPQKDVCAGLQ
jgi:WD40 repeat protein